MPWNSELLDPKRVGDAHQNPVSPDIENATSLRQIHGLGPPARHGFLVRAATGQRNGSDRRWGVAPGDEATLLILDASPIESISNTKRVHLVIQGGVMVDRELLRN